MRDFKQNFFGKVTVDDIVNRYMELKRQLIEKKKQDKNLIITELIDGKLPVKDYADSSIEQRYAKFVTQEILEFADEDKLDEIDVNISQLQNSVCEYQNYLKYKFIVDDVKKIFMDKDKHKNVSVQTRKEIDVRERKILKLSSKINGKGDKANDKLVLEQEGLILEVKELYRTLDTNIVHDKISTTLNESSSIKDALYLASSFYNYVFQCVRNNETDTPPEEVERQISGLLHFMLWPYTTIINNIGMLEERDILLIIKDRYQLLNITVSKEDLDEDNLDSLISIIKSVEIGHVIRKNKIDVEELGYRGEFKKIVNG